MSDEAGISQQGGVNANLSGGSSLSIGGDVVAHYNTTTNITNINQAALPAALSLHQLPPPPRDFVGRTAELQELLDNLTGGVTISGLHGLGGIGKTALALVLAERLTPQYPAAQFYLDLQGASDHPVTPAEALAHVIRAYHPTAKLPEAEGDLRGLYLSVLHNQKALVLLDNARDAEQVASLIPPAACCLLVTSRQHFHLPGLYSKNLEQMPAAEAQALLIKIAPRLSSPLPAGEGSGVRVSEGPGASAGDEIAQLCGYLPLALRLTASLLAERVDLTPADLIRRLRDTGQRLKLTGVEASLQLSYDLLPADLQTHWRALAVFPDSFDRPAAMAVWALTNADQAQDVLGELVKYSLLEYAPAPAPIPDPRLRAVGKSTDRGKELPPSPDDGKAVVRRGAGGEGGGGARYRLHDLARLFASSRLSQAEHTTAQQRHATHYESVLSQADGLYKQGGDSIQRGLTLFDSEWKHIQVGQAWAAENAEKDETAAQLCITYPDVGIEITNLRQDPHQKINWIEVALQVSRHLKNRKMEGVHTGNLGTAYAMRGETKQAMEFYSQALTIAQEINDLGNASAWLGNLGVIYSHLGDTGPQEMGVIIA